MGTSNAWRGMKGLDPEWTFRGADDLLEGDTKLGQVLKGIPNAVLKVRYRAVEVILLFLLIGLTRLISTGEYDMLLYSPIVLLICTCYLWAQLVYSRNGILP